MSDLEFRVEPYTPNIGAVIHDIDLSAPISDGTAAALRRALFDRQVIFFRRQSLTLPQLLAFARVFGDPDKAKAFFPRHPDEALVEVLESRPGATSYGTDHWHADITFSANPPTGTVLYAREVPPVGGDTIWSSASRVYDSLAPTLAAYLEGLQAVHSFEHSAWPRFFLSQPDGRARYAEARAEHLPVVHPVVRVHPFTGRKVVYVNPNFTDRILGMHRQESDALLTYLFGLFEKPDFQARLRWERDTVAVWDNRATVHYAVSDYHPHRRLMHRVTFGEDDAFRDRGA